MSVLDSLRNLFSLEPFQLEERAEPDPGSLEDFYLRRFGTTSASYRIASVRQALGVPAIFGIVSTIANTVGTLALEGYRNGQRVAPDARPRLIVRPDPNRRPGSFWRDSAWNVATRGEAWWWIAKRDVDGQPLALYNVPPQQIRVESNPRNSLRPVIYWLDVEMPNDDMRQITYVREPGDLRGQGPLQLCGAAVSVAVEAQDWAANFYGDGGNPSVLIKHAGILGGDEDEDGYSEAERLRRQWIDKPNNVPRVIDQMIENVEYVQPNPQGAQMMQAREFQVGEIARMFGFPQSLIGYAVAGSSLTYQNVGQELDKLTRTCLIPNFLEKFEQEMTDLLPRSWSCEFNVDRLLRADVKTRWEVYDIATRVLGAEEGANLARLAEGMSAGDIETAPVPKAPPQAVITSLPVQQRALADLRCEKCGRLAGRVGGPAEIECKRCGTLVKNGAA
jgi:HK97 family phage portal protein